MIDFDFARYIAERRGEVVSRAYTGATYAFAGERKMRRSFIGARPVTMAIEATARLWNERARAELLSTAAKAAEREPRMWSIAKRAAQRLGVEPPPIYLAPATWPATMTTLGTDEQPYVVVRADVHPGLSDDELAAALGHQLGHIQNGHVPYTTALHYIQHAAFVFVRWMVQPATLTLRAWARRADVTCDRAALLASQDLAATRSMLGKVFPAGKLLEKRVKALELFAGGALYAQATGGDPDGKPSTDDIDKQVADLL